MQQALHSRNLPHVVLAAAYPETIPRKEAVVSTFGVRQLLHRMEGRCLWETPMEHGTGSTVGRVTSLPSNLTPMDPSYGGDR